MQSSFKTSASAHKVIPAYQATERVACSYPLWDQLLRVMLHCNIIYQTTIGSAFYLHQGHYFLHSCCCRMRGSTKLQLSAARAVRPSDYEALEISVLHYCFYLPCWCLLLSWKNWEPLISWIATMRLSALKLQASIIVLLYNQWPHELFKHHQPESF